MQCPGLLIKQYYCPYLSVRFVFVDQRPIHFVDPCLWAFPVTPQPVLVAPQPNCLLHPSSPLTQMYRASPALEPATNGCCRAKRDLLTYCLTYC